MYIMNGNKWKYSVDNMSYIMVTFDIVVKNYVPMKPGLAIMHGLLLYCPNVLIA